MPDFRWDEIPRDLIEARLVLHHAVQLVAAAGQSLLPARPDDSQQSLSLGSSTWLGKAIGDSQVGLEPVELLLSVRGATLPLGGRTLAEGLDWLTAKLGKPLVPPAHPPDFPHHPLAEGARFPEGGLAARRFLADLFAGTQRILAPHLAPLRMWPHHFDLACSLGWVNAGFSPGDGQDGLPYWYMTLAAEPPSLPALGGGGRWRTSGWKGAELPIEPRMDGRRVQAFFASVLG